jgi:acyl-CoA-binding protein
MSNNSTHDSFAFKLFEGMQKDNLNYIYRGVFTQSITDGILSLTEANLEKAGKTPKIKKRVFTIMVEGLQNITRHQEIDKKTAKKEEIGIFILQDINKRYYITTGNPILKENISSLTEQLNKINSLNTEELKQYYKNILNDNIISDKGGAGLGLIEMARKSGNKLIFDFVDLNDNYSYFYLNTEISQDNENKTDILVKQKSNFLNNVKELHKILNDEEIVLIFNGIFTQDSLLYLLSIMENQMQEHNFNLKKKVFNIMVEMLQNIVKHASKGNVHGENPGIFFINQKNNQYILNTGNYIKNKLTDELYKKLSLLNSMTDEELNSYYEKSLFDFQIDNSKESGLGLIELRLKTKRKLDFEIIPYDSEYSFFALKTIIE